QRRVHVRDALLGDGSDCLTNGGDVPAGEGIDATAVHQLADGTCDLLRRLARIDDLQLDGSPEQAGLVHLPAEELRHGLAGRAEDPARPLERNGQTDPDGVWIDALQTVPTR